MIQTGITLIWCFGLTISNGVEQCELHGKVAAPSIAECEEYALEIKDRAWKEGFENNHVYCIAVQEL